MSITLSSPVLAFTGLAIILTITPGADMALVARNALAYGRTAAFATSAGCCSGLAVHAAASAAGLSAILVRSATAFIVVKMVGAAYLLFLGVQTLWQSRKSARREPPLAVSSAAAPYRPRAPRAYLQGLLNNVLNPKVALFYWLFLPQFIAPGEPILLKSLLLAGIHIVLSLIWLFAYSHLVARLTGLLTRPRVKQMMERFTAAVLLTFGLRLAIERR